MTEPRKYRKKPVVIEAMQVLDDFGNHLEIAGWIDKNGGNR